jgi:hypothetical protein
MRHGEAAIIKDIHGIARGLIFRFVGAGLHAGDEDITNFVFTWAVDFVRITFDGFGKTMRLIAGADCDDVGFKL